MHCANRFGGDEWVQGGFDTCTNEVNQVSECSLLSQGLPPSRMCGFACIRGHGKLEIESGPCKGKIGEPSSPLRPGLPRTKQTPCLRIESPFEKEEKEGADHRSSTCFCSEAQNGGINSARPQIKLCFKLPEEKTPVRYIFHLPCTGPWRSCQSSRCSPSHKNPGQ